jgi:hypothetical protein
MVDEQGIRLVQIERVLYDRGCECRVFLWRDGWSGSISTGHNGLGSA